MGKSGIDAEGQEEIRRTSTKEIKTEELRSMDKIFTVNKNIPPMQEDMGNSKGQRMIKRSNSFVLNGRLDELRAGAGMMPHHVPQKKAELSKQRIAEEMERFHSTLEAEESKAFDEKGILQIKRKRYASLSTRDKKKRVDAAMKRKANAAKVAEVEESMKGSEWKHYDIDSDTFEKEVRGFMMLTESPFKMDKDDAFARNLKRNYELCETAFRMKKWVSDAVEGGYFPKGMDLVAVEAKIARYAELKEYLDTQKELMKNSYYQYMAKGDISYNDIQITRLKNATGNEELRNYLTIVQKLRSLSFVRRKGMDSVEKKSIAEGKRQAEILRDRAKKRQLVRTFSDEALKIQGNQNFRDNNYDAKFTEKAFTEALQNFRKLNVKICILRASKISQTISGEMSAVLKRQESLSASWQLRYRGILRLRMTR